MTAGPEVAPGGTRTRHREVPGGTHGGRRHFEGVQVHSQPLGTGGAGLSADCDGSASLGPRWRSRAGQRSRRWERDGSRAVTAGDREASGVRSGPVPTAVPAGPGLSRYTLAPLHGSETPARAEPRWGRFAPLRAPFTAVTPGFGSSEGRGARGGGSERLPGVPALPSLPSETPKCCAGLRDTARRAPSSTPDLLGLRGNAGFCSIPLLAPGQSRFSRGSLSVPVCPFSVKGSWGSRCPHPHFALN